MIPVLLVAGVLVGCGGGHDAARADQPRIATAVLASNDPSGFGVEVRNSRRADGQVVGEPLRPTLAIEPPIGLGSAQASCSGTNLTPTKDNLTAVRKATLCLVNAERKARGLVPLRLNSKLATAAIRHSRDMVKKKYFAHTTPSGVTFDQRIKKTGYMSGYTRWTVGENLAWGAGGAATPAEIVQAWMDSAHHKANILNAKFREAGFGIVLGLPMNGYSSGATYSNEFGKRS